MNEGNKDQFLFGEDVTPLIPDTKNGLAEVPELSDALTKAEVERFIISNLAGAEEIETRPLRSTLFNPNLLRVILPTAVLSMLAGSCMTAFTLGPSGANYAGKVEPLNLVASPTISPLPSVSPTVAEKKVVPTPTPTPTPEYARVAGRHLVQDQAYTIKEVNDTLGREKIGENIIYASVSSAQGFKSSPVVMTQFSPKIKQIVTNTGNVYAVSIHQKVFTEAPKSSDLTIQVFNRPETFQPGGPRNILIAHVELPVNLLSMIYNDQQQTNQVPNHVTFFLNESFFRFQGTPSRLSNLISLKPTSDRSINYGVDLIFRDNSTDLQVDSRGSLTTVSNGHAAWYSFSFNSR